MIQIQEQTFEEKREMYRKCSKDELIGMLIEANKYIDRLSDGIGVHVNNEACDICGNHPNVIVRTDKGTFCQDHVKF